MVATMFLQADERGSRKSCAQALDLGAQPGRGKRLAQPKPDAARTSAATNGSQHSSRFEPRPLLLLAGDRNATHQPLPKAADMTRFWLGRSVAGRLLDSRNHRRGPGKPYPPKATNPSRLRGISRRPKSPDKLGC
jgi:hypothetical protein